MEAMFECSKHSIPIHPFPEDSLGNFSIASGQGKCHRKSSKAVSMKLQSISHCQVCDGVRVANVLYQDSVNADNDAGSSYLSLNYRLTQQEAKTG